MKISTLNLSLHVFIITCIKVQTVAFSFQSTALPTRRKSRGASWDRSLRDWHLHQSLNNEDLPTSRQLLSSLKAVAIESPEGGIATLVPSFLSEAKSVIAASLLITGNTVGASALVLPEVASQPGLAASTALFGGAFLVNLVSGLIIAEVAIKEHEASGGSVPASFKEFAEANLNNAAVANLVSAVSVFTNSCVLSFTLVRAGSIIASLIGSTEPMALSTAYAAGLVLTLVSLSREQLASIASGAVMMLFASFLGLLLPGLASIQDPVAAFFTPGTSSDMMSATADAAPVILMTMIFQNIVPSVTKLLKYDRVKTITALAIGSSIPPLIFIAWCFACIGGNVDPSAGAGGPLVTAFSVAAVIGSCIGCSMSLSEEIETSLRGDQEVTTSAEFSFPAVAASVSMPMAGALLFAGGEDFSNALRVAGSYGSPLLYGAIPVLMAWTQRNQMPALKNLVPGGPAVLGALGLAASGLLAHQLSCDVMGIIFDQ